MRTFFFTIDDSSVRDEPVVPTASQVVALCMRPPVDVGLVRIWDAQAEAMQLSLAVLRQMENVLMTVIDEAVRMKGLVMSN